MMSRVMGKVLVAGAGVTGAVTASVLKKELSEKCHLAIWDKAKGIGGRMATTRSPHDDKCTVDLGAQYISSDPQDYINHQRFYDELSAEGIIRPLSGTIIGDKPRPEGTKHFVSPNGLGSLVKYFITKSGGEMRPEHTIQDISECGGQWSVTTDSGYKEAFDCVVLTMPVPQILQLQGSISDVLNNQKDVKQKLQHVQYSSRFALGLFYDKGVNIDVPWCAKYFQGDPVIVFISIDNKKRGQVSPDVGSSVLVHTSVPFSLKHLDEDKETVCTQYVLPRVQQLLPDLPQPGTIKPHKWRYSQVFKGYEGSPGSLVLQTNPLLVCAGDAFMLSKFDGCLDSAISASNTVTQHISSNL